MVTEPSPPGAQSICESHTWLTFLEMILSFLLLLRNLSQESHTSAYHFAPSRTELQSRSRDVGSGRNEHSPRLDTSFFVLLVAEAELWTIFVACSRIMSSLSQLGARLTPFRQPDSDASSDPPAPPPNDDDDIEPVEEPTRESQDSVYSASNPSHQPGPALPLASSIPSSFQTALTSVALYSAPSPKPVAKEASNDSIAMETEDEGGVAKRQDPILPPPPTPPRAEVIDLSSSFPAKPTDFPTPSSSSAPKRRTPEEQVELKLAAQKRVRPPLVFVAGRARSGELTRLLPLSSRRRNRPSLMLKMPRLRRPSRPSETRSAAN